MCDMENYNELCCGANVNICAGVLFGIALDFSDVIADSGSGSGSDSGSDDFERTYVACLSEG